MLKILKKILIKELQALGYKVVDFGPTVYDPQDDYAVFGTAMAEDAHGGE